LDKFDLLVIGGGSGGVATANRAAQHGATVALVEAGALGGTCVNVGCVPKKIMWQAAHVAETIQNASDYGFDVDVTKFSWASLVQYRQAYIKKLNTHYAKGLENNGVTLIQGKASLVDAKTIMVDNVQYQANHILIATGGEPVIPDIPGAEFGIDSDGFFALTELPRKVAIIGAGYIAVELAGMLNGLGSKVTLILRKQKVLRTFDEMLSDNVMQAMRDHGIDIMMQQMISKLTKQENNITLVYDNGTKQQDYDSVIWAIGRKPRSYNLNLSQVGIHTDEEGYITVDDYQNTNVSSIYAVGDVTGRQPLTPVAIAAGRRLAMRLFANEADSHLNYDLIPTVVFSHPPLGTMGLTEAQARAQYGDKVKIYENRFTPLYYAFHEQPIKSHYKLVTLDEKIIGCHIFGIHSDEILQGFAVAIKMGATIDDLHNTVAIHPTSAEEIVTIR